MTDFAPAKWKTLILLHLAVFPQSDMVPGGADIVWLVLLGISLIMISVVIQTVRAS